MHKHTQIHIAHNRAFTALDWDENDEIRMMRFRFSLKHSQSYLNSHTITDPDWEDEDEDDDDEEMLESYLAAKK